MKNNILLLLIGPSGSGKTAIAGLLEEKLGLKILQSYTTREPRFPDEPGHIFVSEAEMPDRSEMAAYTYFNGNHYWATYDQLEENDIYIIDPAGIEDLKKNYKGEKSIRVVEIRATEEVRFNRMVEQGRGEASSRGRIEHDRGVFGLMYTIADAVVYNDVDPLENAVKQIGQYLYMENLAQKLG